MAKNPGHKSSFKAICGEIQQCCSRFNNQAAALKVHFPKGASAKSRAKRKAPAVKNEEEDEKE